MAGCHTLLHLCASVISVGGSSLQEASVGSVGSVGIQFSARSFCAFRGFCGNTVLSKKLLCVPWVLWEYSSQQEASVRSVGSVGYSSPTDCTDQHRRLVALVRPRNPQNSQKFGCVSGCVGMAGCHTLLHLCKSVISVGDFSLQEASVGSVGSVGVPLLALLRACQNSQYK